MIKKLMICRLKNHCARIITHQQCALPFFWIGVVNRGMARYVHGLQTRDVADLCQTVGFRVDQMPRLPQAFGLAER